jgi:hypothetical protein
VKGEATAIVIFIVSFALWWVLMCIDDEEMDDQ